jgi:polysaccharide pyruvyl transferase WcaK-like protein
MNILVEPSDYILLNMGDISMLQVAVARLNALWPNANIKVLSDDANTLKLYCPRAEPLVMDGRRTWFAEGCLFGRLSHGRPRPVTNRFLQLERYLRRRWPSLAESVMRRTTPPRGVGGKHLIDFLDAIATADIVVVSGMGGITHAFSEYALQVLETLGLAIHYGKPTAMFGQGIGPINDPRLKARAKAILASVDLICLRESRTGGPLLESLGVPPERVLTTGDDALEVAHQMRSEKPGGGLGVNLRAAGYSGVDQHLAERIRPILQDAARTREAPMIPLPISRRPGEEDSKTIRELTVGYYNVSDCGEDLDTPLKVIKQVQRCRVVVAGSYHAAVFALAQGIPAVGLANSEYYADKFLGLADQFNGGCEVVFLNDPQLPERLPAAIDRAWRQSESIRQPLLDAAVHQVELSRAAYRRLHELFLSRGSG